MSAGAFDLGSYGAEIVLNDSQFEQTMRNSENSLTSHENKMNNWASKIGIITTGAIAGFATALAGATVAGVKMSDDLHKALNGLQASTGATDLEMKGMEESLKNIYNNNFGEDFQDIADSMALVKQNTGLVGDSLESTTKNAIMLRDTFGKDIEETTRTANGLMNQFGLTSKEAFNLMAQGIQNGADKNGDLLDSLNEYGVQFYQLGFNAEQFTNILIDGAESGSFSIDKVGDAMKEFNIRSKDASQTSAQGFELLGLNAKEMTSAFAKGGDTAQAAFKQVINSLVAMKDPVQQNTAGVALFGTQFEDLGIQGIEAFAHIGNNASLAKDSLEKINQVKYNSFGQALEGLKRNFVTGLIDPVEKNVLPALSDLANWTNAHMPEIQSGINSAMSSASKVFDGFKESIKFVIDNMNILLPVIVGVTGAITAQMIINTLVSLYNKWKLATEAQTTVQWLLNAAMNANPIGVVALAIGGLIAAGVALYMNFDKIKTYAINLWDKLGNLKPVLLALLGPLGGVVSAGVEVWKNWDTIMAKAEQLGSKIKSFFSNLKIHIPLPHFDFKTVTKTIAGIKVPIPDFDVNWYATGTIVDKPTILGAGEAGAEAIVPLIGRRMDPFADAVYKRIEEKMRFDSLKAQSSTTNNNKTINLNNVEIKANNPMELFQGIDNMIRSM